MLITAAIAQVINTTTDAGYNMSIVADSTMFATNCNGCILAGPYSSQYGHDKQLVK